MNGNRRMVGVAITTSALQLMFGLAEQRENQTLGLNTRNNSSQDL